MDNPNLLSNLKKYSIPSLTNYREFKPIFIKKMPEYIYNEYLNEYSLCSCVDAK